MPSKKQKENKNEIKVDLLTPDRLRERLQERVQFHQDWLIDMAKKTHNKPLTKEQAGLVRMHNARVLELTELLDELNQRKPN